MGRGKSMSITWLALVCAFSAALFPANARAAEPTSASTADCHAGTLVTVVAHLDDDLLFVDPAISERLDAGWCITTVHLIGGANGAKFAYVQTARSGPRLAYARMAGVAGRMDANRTCMFAGKLGPSMVLKAQPQVRLLELRLPGGAVRGGKRAARPAVGPARHAHHLSDGRATAPVARPTTGRPRRPR